MTFDLPPRKHVVIYTDGGCDPNPGRGGYGVVLLREGHRKELSGGFRLTTNNRMEIFAAIAGLEALKEPCQVTLYSDSEYLVKAMNEGWASRWQSRGWMRNKREKALNPDLWEKLLELCAVHTVTFVWLRGHTGLRENERCDALAMQALQSKDLPPDEAYENQSRIDETVNIPAEGQPCRKCGAPLVKRKSQKKPHPWQQYTYEYYLLCPACGTSYTVEETKKPLQPPPRLI